MTLPAAQKLIVAALAKMEAAYQRPPFDEWVIVQLGVRGRRFLAYSGPRADDLVAHYDDHMRYLRAQLVGKALRPGDFEFARDAGGGFFDALIVGADGLYIVFNHTGKTIAEITADPLWLGAQGTFFALAQKFAFDPIDPDEA